MQIEKERVVDNEEWEKEPGICGILCNELVRKECGSDGGIKDGQVEMWTVSL